MSLSLRPLVAISAAFALGILLSDSPVLVAAVTLAAAGGAAFAWRTRRPGWIPAALLLAFSAAGGWRARMDRAPAPDDIARFARPGLVTVSGTVAGDVEAARDAWMCELHARSVTLADGRTAPCTGSVAVRLRRDARSPVLDYGDAIEVRGRLEAPQQATNPGSFDYAGYLAQRGVFAVFSARRPGAWQLAHTPPSAASAVFRAASRCRRSLQDTLGGLLPRAEAGLLAGILIGTRNTLPPQFDDDFGATGTAHILATAGLHVGLVAGLLLGALRICRVGRKPACAATLLLLAFYALLAGARPSVVRAVLMTDLFLLGVLLDRESDGPTALAAAALILLAVRPGYLYDVGFELSFATVGSIIAVLSLARPVLDRLRPAPGGDQPRAVRTAGAVLYGLGNFAALAAAAQIGSAPLVAQYFNQIALVGPAANLLIVPVLFALMGAGFAVWAAAHVWPPCTHWLAAWVLSPLLAYILGAARTCARVPLGVLYVPSPGWPLIALYYASLLALVGLFHARRARRGAARRIETAPEPEEVTAVG